MRLYVKIVDNKRKFKSNKRNIIKKNISDVIEVNAGRIMLPLLEMELFFKILEYNFLLSIIF